MIIIFFSLSVALDIYIYILLSILEKRNIKVLTLQQRFIVEHIHSLHPRIINVNEKYFFIKIDDDHRSFVRRLNESLTLIDVRCFSSKRRSTHLSRYLSRENESEKSRICLKLTSVILLRTSLPP